MLRVAILLALLLATPLPGLTSAGTFVHNGGLADRSAATNAASGSGGTWVAVVIPPGTSAFDLWFNQSGSGTLVADSSMFVEGGSPVAHVLLAPPRMGDSASLRVSGEGGSVSLVDDPTTSSFFAYRMCEVSCAPRSTDVRLVFILGGKTGTWKLETQHDGDAPTIVLGDAVSTKWASQFGGTALDVVAGGATLARANALSDASFHVAHRLRGAYASTSLIPELSMGARSGRGERACPCVFDEPTDASFGPPGEYSFELTSASADSDVLLIIADVEVPW